MLLFLIIYSPAAAADYRTAALGGSDLVLNHPANRADLFHTAGNCAYLLQSQEPERVTLRSELQFRKGDLKRKLDPGRRRQTAFSGAHLKKISDNRIIYGKITYLLEDLYNVPGALNPQPYSSDPLFISDRTAGDFAYQGPLLQVCFQQQLRRRWGLGIAVVYGVEQGIKNQYTQPRILQRKFTAQAAATYLLGRGWTAGASFNYLNDQDQYEFRQNAFTSAQIQVYKYISEAFSYSVLQDFDHFMKRDGWRGVLAVQKNSGGAGGTHLLQVRYGYEKREAFYTTHIRQFDPDWLADTYGAAYEYRWQQDQNRWSAGFRTSLLRRSSFSEHRRFELLITERQETRLKVEAGAGARFQAAVPLRLVLQTRLIRVRDNYDDYQSRIFRRTRVEDAGIGGGVEAVVSTAIRLFFGYRHDRSNLTSFSPRYLPDHHSNTFSMAMDFYRTRRRMVLLIQYFRQSRPGTKLLNEGWLFGFSLEIGNG